MRRLVLLATALTAALPAQAADLTIRIDGATAAGAVRTMLFADAASFEQKLAGVASFTAQPQAGRAAVTFHDLPPGHYAIAAFQDGNGNERLDTNLFGVPNEPYGLSNDGRTFDGATVMLDPSGLTVTILLH